MAYALPLCIKVNKNEWNVYDFLMQVVGPLKIFYGVAHDGLWGITIKNEVAIKYAEEHSKTCLGGLKIIPSKLILIIIIQLLFEYVLTLVELCFCVGNLKHLPLKQLY